MAPSKGFVHGAMLLAGAAMVTKLLGSVYTIVLQNIIGDHGMGLFQMAYPIYATLLAIATAGFPVAISKLVSERLALGDVLGARQTFRVALFVLSLAGIATFLVLFCGANVWANIAGDDGATWAIQAIAPALLVVPILSAIRGYFQGYQQMGPTAYSQVLEQFVRVATILGLAIWFEHLGLGPRLSAAGAAFGAVTGAVAGLIMLIIYYVRRHPLVSNRDTAIRFSTLALTKRLFYYALPISIGALVVPLMNNVDVITVVNLLKSAGESQHLATTEFGLLTGRAFKLMMLPTTLATGIGIAVMPAVSEAFTLGFRKLMSDRIDLAIRLTMMMALPASIGLAILARPIDISLFQDDSATLAIQIMAFATIFASLQTVLAAVLQGAGWVYIPVFNLLIAGGIKLLMNLILVPKFGINGAALSTVISYLAAAILNLWAMKKNLQEHIDLARWLLRPAFASTVMASVVFACLRQWELWGGAQLGRLSALGICVVSIALGMLVYFVALVASGVMSEKELNSVPKIGPQLVSWCTKVGLLK